MDKNSLSHTSWNCKYHIVFAPKYRRKVIYGKIRVDIGKILRLVTHDDELVSCCDQIVDMSIL